MSGTCREVSPSATSLRQHGLDIPQVTQVAHVIRTRNGGPAMPLTVAEGVTSMEDFEP
jgi:hypothetical protein